MRKLGSEVWRREQPEPDCAEIRGILGDIVDEDERDGEVITRLRGLLKRGTPNRQPLSLNEVVQGVLQLTRSDLVRRGITVDTCLGEGLPIIHADRVPIEQVLINIIGNACDAMAANAPGDRVLRVATDTNAGMIRATVLDGDPGRP